MKHHGRADCVFCGNPLPILKESTDDEFSRWGCGYSITKSHTYKRGKFPSKKICFHLDCYKKCTIGYSTQAT